MNNNELTIEFDRQVSVLVDKEYPKLLDQSVDKFRSYLSPLRAKLSELTLPAVDLEQGKLPFVIVIPRELLPAEESMPLTELKGKSGVVKLDPLISSDFDTLAELAVPPSPYLLIDIDRGKETLNVRPEDALVTIKADERTPLTIAEGVAIVTQYPNFLRRNNCFSLLASRHPGDQRVPAIWINGKGHPNLGWCWDRNPHTWLGSASGVDRF